MASVQASRFALLNIDDDYDSDENKKKSKPDGSKGNQSQNASRKKNRKKKKNDQQMENEELRNMAFGKGPKTKAGKDADGRAVNGAAASSEIPPPEKQWQDWKKVDTEFTADVYEKDLQQALLMSKLDIEEQKQVISTVEEKEPAQNQKGKKKKKDKTATKAAPMSLGAFQQSTETKPDENGAAGDGFEDIHEKPATSITPQEQDPKFFDNVDKEKEKIIRQEHMQEEYRKQYIVANAQTQHFEKEIRKKDEDIDKLKKINSKHKTELKEVKERNQQLCLILAQGEMKGKTAVLLELEQLKQVRDELMEEVSSLTTDLEKERSKVHALAKSATAAADKSKGGKHSK